MTALAISAELERIMRTIVPLVVLGDPTTIQRSPAIILGYMSFTHPLKNQPPARNLVGFDHLFTARLAIDYQDPQQAEQLLLELVDRVPLALDADPHLAAALGRGWARISDGSSGYATYAKMPYRVVDYTITCTEKYEGT